MAEIFEIEGVPAAVSTSAQGAESQKEKGGSSSGPTANDKHIPTFDFNGYPTVNQNE
jgi:hypothetical protein